MKVKKEAIIATIIGLAIGLLITGGILRAQKALKIQPKLEEKPVTTTDNTITNNQPEESALFIDIKEPEDNSIVSESSVTLTGSTLAGTYIAIIAEKNEYLIVPNDIGQFTQDVSLVSGANTITITVYTEIGDKVEKTLNIVYTTAEI